MQICDLIGSIKYKIAERKFSYDLNYELKNILGNGSREAANVDYTSVIIEMIFSKIYETTLWPNIKLYQISSDWSTCWITWIFETLPCHQSRDFILGYCELIMLMKQNLNWSPLARCPFRGHTKYRTRQDKTEWRAVKRGQGFPATINGRNGTDIVIQTQKHRYVSALRLGQISN